jgi:hypothetical protein
MENIPFFYPPRVPGKYPPPLKIISSKKPPAEDDEPEAVETASAAPDVPPPKSCPLWAVRAPAPLPLSSVRYCACYH